MNNRSYIAGHKGHPHYITDQSIRLLKKDFNKKNKHQDILNVLKALSDKTKLKIYLLLHEVEEIAVTDICHILNIKQTTASHALSDLKKLKLIDCKRCGQLVCYSLKQQPKKRNLWLKFIDKLFI